jgi:DNA-binding CsgD family transcriptional regulator/PAS domain-containing protein
MQFDPRKLTGLLIESVIDDAAFASLPQYFAHYANTASSQIQFHSADGAVAAASYGISDAILERYNTYYWKHDVWALEYQRLGIDTTVATDSYVDAHQFRETEIYNDLLRPEGNFTRCVGFVVNMGDGERMLFGAHRVASQGEFEPELVRHLNLLQAPMIHVVQARRRLEQGRGRLAERALDAGVDVVVVADARGLVVYANRAARALFAGGGPFRLRSGHVASSDPQIARSMSRAIAAACTGRGGRDLTLAPPFERIRVAIDPLDGAHSKLACVRIRDEATWAAHCAAAARVQHGFTAAETRLAQALLRGLTPADYATQRGVSLPTVRTQLRSLFDKAGVGGQAELVKRLGRM